MTFLQLQSGFIELNKKVENLELENLDTGPLCNATRERERPRKKIAAFRKSVS